MKRRFVAEVPHLFAEWHDTQNKKLTPYEVTRLDAVTAAVLPHGAPRLVYGLTGYCVRLINTSSRSGSVVLISRTLKFAFCTSAKSVNVVVFAGSKLIESRPFRQTAPIFCSVFGKGLGGGLYNIK